MFDVSIEPAGNDLMAREFSDYASATEMMHELENLQAELSSNVNALDSLWLAPSELEMQEPAAPRVVPNSEVCVCMGLLLLVG